MRVYLHHAPHLREGPRRLAACLRTRGLDVTLHSYPPPEDADRPGMASSSRVLRWGFSCGSRAQLTTLTAAGVRAPRVRDDADPGYVGRREAHTGGGDLRDPPTVPDYFVEIVPTVREWRVHVAFGRVIASGLKVPIPGAHPWVRCWDGGWRVDYGQRAPWRVRRAAVRACAALGYALGGADVGVAASALARPVVYEVNSAPALDWAVAIRYADALCRRWSTLAP